MTPNDNQVALPELPEARIVSRQTDSAMRTIELRTYSESDMRAYATEAVRLSQAAGGEAVAWVRWHPEHGYNWRTVSEEALGDIGTGWIGARIYTTQPAAQVHRADGWPPCPECQSGVLYECPACSSSNYPRDAFQPSEAAQVQQEAVEPMTGDLLPCPFCGRANQDRWPCEWLDGSGANVIRCTWCHGAAPMNVWNRRATHPAADALGAVRVGGLMNVGPKVAAGRMREHADRLRTRQRLLTSVADGKADPSDGAAADLLETGARALESALAQAPAVVPSSEVTVTDEMARRAEIVREQSLRKIASYGSAGVEERHNMAMRDALEAALGQGVAHG